MAGIFGAAVMIGVVAGLRDNSAALAIIALCLVAVAALTSGSSRALAIASVAGFALGSFAGVNHEAPAGAADGPLPAVIDARIESDPRLTAGGQFVRVTWVDDDGGRRSAPLIMPAPASAGRGDRVIVGEADRLVVDGLIIAERVEVEPASGRLERLRRHLRQRATINTLAVVPGSHGSLALGLLIGDDSGLTQAERQAMRASGLSHITAVSGSNVAMVIGVVAFVLVALVGRPWLWIPPQLATIISYVWIVGTEPPIVRAAIMGSLVLLAIGLGRPSHLFTLLFLAGGIMGLHNPEVLSTLSFQLSFLSMLALGVVGTRVQRMEGRGKRIAAILASPAGAAVATAPLIALRFGAFSLGTVPANVLVAPLIAPATGLAAVTASIGGVPLLGDLAGLPLWAATGLVLEVARFVGSFPGAYWTFGPPGGGVVVIVYLALAALVTPFVPEGRLLVNRLRSWVTGEPAVALSSVTAALALLWALMSAAD